MNIVNNISKEGTDLIKKFESCKLNAYRDIVGVVTIGWGSTVYANGKPVMMGDNITIDEANTLFDRTIHQYVNCVDIHLKRPPKQHQFDAMVSLAYNIGCKNFETSSVLRKFNVNPNDETIRDSFILWDMAGGKHIKGLLGRRFTESDFYFKQ